MKAAALLLPSVFGLALAAPRFPPTPRDAVFELLRELPGARGFCAALLHIPCPNITKTKTLEPQPITVSGRTTTITRNPDAKCPETQTVTSYVTSTRRIANTIAEKPDPDPVSATDVHLGAVTLTVTATHVQTAQATNSLLQTVTCHLTGYVTDTVFNTVAHLDSQATTDISIVVVTITQYAAGFVTTTISVVATNWVTGAHADYVTGRATNTQTARVTLSFTDTVTATVANPLGATTAWIIAGAAAHVDETTRVTNDWTRNATLTSSRNASITDRATAVITTIRTGAATVVTTAFATVVAAPEGHETKEKRAHAPWTPKPLKTVAARKLSSACSRLYLTRQERIVYTTVTAPRCT
ncbi:hypothetical protein E4U53_004335, partial [Claviceps sorghi]